MAHIPTLSSLGRSPQITSACSLLNGIRSDRLLVDMLQTHRNQRRTRQVHHNSPPSRLRACKHRRSSSRNMLPLSRRSNLNQPPEMPNPTFDHRERRSSDLSTCLGCPMRSKRFGRLYRVSIYLSSVRQSLTQFVELLNSPDSYVPSDPESLPSTPSQHAEESPQRHKYTRTRPLLRRRIRLGSRRIQRANRYRTGVRWQDNDAEIQWEYSKSSTTQDPPLQSRTLRRPLKTNRPAYQPRQGRQGRRQTIRHSSRKILAWSVRRPKRRLPLIDLSTVLSEPTTMFNVTEMDGDPLWMTLLVSGAPHWARADTEQGREAVKRSLRRKKAKKSLRQSKWWTNVLFKDDAIGHLRHFTNEAVLPPTALAAYDHNDPQNNVTSDYEAEYRMRSAATHVRLRTSKPLYPVTTLANNRSVARTLNANRDTSSSSRSFIHQQLLLSNPPTPKDLLAHIRMKPGLFTVQSAKILARYAHRVSDIRTYAEIKTALSHMGQSRIRDHEVKDIVRKLTKQQIQAAYRKELRRMKAEEEQENVWQDGREIPTSVEEIEAHGRGLSDDPTGLEVPRQQALYWSVWRPDTWAGEMIPIRTTLSHRRSDVIDHLGLLHHDLITAELETISASFSGHPALQHVIRPRFSLQAPPSALLATIKPTEMAKLRSNLLFSPLLIAIYHINKICARDGRGRKGTLEAILRTLHLFMTYSQRVIARDRLPSTQDRKTLPLYSRLPYDGVWLLETFLRLRGDPKPTRQTLELLVRDILWGWPILAGPVSDTSLMVTDSVDMFSPLSASSESVRHFYDLAPPPIAAEVPLKIAHLHQLFKFFGQKWKVFPGPRTIQKVATYAIQVDNVELGHECWEAWWNDMSRPHIRVARWEGDNPRWDHRTVHGRQWQMILAEMVARGWVECEMTQNLDLEADFASKNETLPLFNPLARMTPHVGTPSLSAKPIPSEITRDLDEKNQRWYGWRDSGWKWRWTGASAEEIETGLDMTGQDAGLDKPSQNPIEVQQSGMMDVSITQSAESRETYLHAA